MIPRDILVQYLDLDIVDKIENDFITFLKTKSQKDQVMLYFKVEKYLKSSELLEIYPDYQIGTLIKRLENSDYIQAMDKEGKFVLYSLTGKGTNKADNIIKTFLDKSYEYQEYLIEKRKKNYISNEDEENFKKIITALIDANIKPTMDEKVIIDLKKLSEYDYEATDLIYANFSNAIEMIRNYFNQEVEKELKREDIIFSNAHESIFKEIHDYDRKYEGLIFTKGLITSKKENIVLQVQKYWYTCKNETCQYSKEAIGSTKRLKSKKGCPMCKSDIYISKQDTENHYESKLTNIDSNVSFPIIFKGSNAKKFALVGLGDEIEVIGHLEDKIIENNKGEKESIIKCLVINSFQKTDYQKELTPEEIETANRIIAKGNIKEYLLTPFREYIESDWLKEIFILQQLTRFNPATKEVPIHIAVMGEPGVGKNQLIKIGEEYFPVCDSIVGADITDAGFKGTVNRDTGIKEIGLAKKTQHGTIFFNEFDKFVKSNNNGKKAASQLLNASITEQEVRLNKAGIKIKFENLDLRHNIIFNPHEEKIAESGKLPHHFMGEILDKSLLSRMIPIYIPKDKKRSLKVMDLMLEDNSSIQKIRKEDYRTLIKFLRSKEVSISTKAKNKIKGIFKDILERDENSMVSPERIAQVLTQVAKACAKINNREEVICSDVQEAYNYYFNALKTTGITLNNLEALFQDKTIEELQTEKEIKLYIEKQIVDNGFLIIEELLKAKDKELVEKVILDLKKTGDYAEFKKGELKRVK